MSTMSDYNHYNGDSSNYADPPVQDGVRNLNSTSNIIWENTIPDPSVVDSYVGTSSGNAYDHMNAQDNECFHRAGEADSHYSHASSLADEPRYKTTSSLGTHFSKHKHQPPGPNHSREDASGAYSSFSKDKEDASGIYANACASVSSSLGGKSLESRESSPHGSNKYHHFYQRARNSFDVRSTPSNGGRGAHPKDMRNHPKKQLKKDKDSDLDTFEGTRADQANRVKFADQIFATPPNPRTSGRHAFSWRGRSVSSTASVGSGVTSVGEGDVASVASAATKSSIDSGTSFNLTAMRHLRRLKHIHLRKRVVLVSTVAMLVLLVIGLGIIRWKGGPHRYEMVGFADEQHRLPKRGITENGMLQPPTIKEGGLGTEGSMDLTKVPPHLRGYYAKMMSAGTEKELHQLQLKNEMIQIQNEIMDAQAKTIKSMAVPEVDSEEFQRQQEELGRINSAGEGRGIKGEVQDQQQQAQEEATTARTAIEANQKMTESTEAELEVARQKTKSQLAASRQKAVEADIQRIASEEEARQNVAETEGLRKAAAAEEEQRVAREQAANEQAAQKQVEQQEEEQPPQPEELQKEMQEILTYLNKKEKG